MSIVNTPIHSLFENIVVMLNGTPISDHARLYSFKAFFTQMFSYSDQVKKHNLEVEYFLEDEVTENTEISFPDNDENPINIRKGWVSDSKIIHGSIVPFIDIMSTNHYLCPGHCLKLEFERSRSNFSLLSDSNNDNFKINILDIVITARALEPLPSISATLQKYRNTGTVQYPITRNIIRMWQQHPGISRIEVNNIYGDGALPRALYVFFLEDGQLLGALNKNPFILKNYNVMEANVMVDGLAHPFEPVRTDFTNGKIDVMPAFRHFMDNVGISDHDCDIGITVKKFRKNLFVMAFDLSPNGVRILIS